MPATLKVEVRSRRDPGTGDFANLNKAGRSEPTGMAASMKVTMVCPPGVTVTVAVPARRLLLISNPALGKVLMPVKASCRPESFP